MTKTILLKIEKITDKMKDLKKEQEKLQDDLQQTLMSLFKTHHAYKIDFETLYGAISDLLEKINNQKVSQSELDVWKQIGESLLSKKPRHTRQKKAA